ncbi:MAG: flagellar hook-basal body complex protein FliE [Candidatus Eisenbacteria bacterium]|nr:flagellar hook-basal body complex protein FliE [Candidatus Latescibacterota bacterium]MBD3301272.1 flagellar hook-basal body complex protein FliE [Candidatus Eisenbacteria bacterium]
MSEAIRPGQSILRRGDILPERVSPRGDGLDFSDLLKKAINDASDLQADAKGLIEAFLRGEPVEIHQLMAAAEEASLSLELLVELRNKLTDAYRTIMTLQ